MSDKLSFLELDPRRTALVLIDCQQWTLGMSIAPHSATKLVNNAERIGTALRRAGGMVVLTRAAFSEGYADMLRAPVDLPLKCHRAEYRQKDWPSTPSSSVLVTISC